MIDVEGATGVETSEVEVDRAENMIEVADVNVEALATLDRVPPLTDTPPLQDELA